MLNLPYINNNFKYIRSCLTLDMTGLFPFLSTVVRNFRTLDLGLKFIYRFINKN